MTTLALILALQTTAPAPTTAPADDIAAVLAEGRASFAEHIEASTHGLDEVAPRRLGELLTITLDGGVLDAVVELPDAGTDRRLVVPLVDWPGTATIQTGLAGTEPGEAVSFRHESTTEPRAFGVITEVYRLGDNLQLTRSVDGLDGTVVVQVIQNAINAQRGEDLVIYVQDDPPESESGGGGGEPVRLRLAGPTFAEVRDAHPEAVARYVEPLLRSLDGTTGRFGDDEAAAFEALLPGLRVDDATRAAVLAEVEAAGAEGFRERRAAAGRLREMGRPAVVVLANLTETERAALSAEQRAAVEALLGEALSLTPEQAAAARDDAALLRRAAGGGDPLVAEAARRRLAEIGGGD